VSRKASLHGLSLPSPRLTWWGALAIVIWLGLPLLAVLALLDAFLYVVFTHLLGGCYGIFCWLS
jgi:hypothetical protein